MGRRRKERPVPLIEDHGVMWSPPGRGSDTTAPPPPPPPPPTDEPGWTPPPPPRPTTGRSFLAMVLAVLLAAGVVGTVLWRERSATSTGVTFASRPSGNVAAIAGSVDRAIVDINTTLRYENARAAGTGVVITSNGEVLTNNHVIDGATSISATDVGNGQTYSAHVVGYDVSHDLAVLQLDNASGLATAKLATSDVGVGASTIAIGNAGGTGGTPAVTTGTVTRLGVSITASDEFGSTGEQLEGLIQTNAQLEPGDSGGPLVDMNGRVVGIDTATTSGFRFNDAGSASYAIPITTAIRIADQIEAGQTSSTNHVGESAFLGVQVSPDDSQSGAVVAGVEDGTPAASTDLAAGDVITAVNGTTISSADDLTAAIEQHKPGDKVRIEWTDQSGDTHSATVTLGAGPAR